MTDDADIPPPRARADFLAADDLEVRLAQALDAGALANGWLITGGTGAGKATLAYRLARAALWPERPAGAASLDVPASSRTFSLVASGGHPDLFVAERAYDEKKERYEVEISVDTVRDLTNFLNLTPSMGGWRVAIIDTADEFNRYSANALLKALEEPPPRTAIFLLSAAPGRLLATLRSRCRTIAIRPLTDGAVAAFLEREGAAAGEQALRIAHAAGGRPGFALSLARGDGAAAIEAVDDFWSAAEAGRDVGQVAQRLSPKSADGVWPHFHEMLIGRIAARAGALARSADARASGWVDIGERIDSLFTRGDAVNLDRYQMVLAAGREFRAALR